MFKRLKKATDEEALRQNIIARLEVKSSTTNTTEFDEWGPEGVKEWNPADEARQTKRLEAWRSSQAQGHWVVNHDATDSPSEFERKRHFSRLAWRSPYFFQAPLYYDKLYEGTRPLVYPSTCNILEGGLLAFWYMASRSSRTSDGRSFT